MIKIHVDVHTLIVLGVTDIYPRVQTLLEFTIGSN